MVKRPDLVDIYDSLANEHSLKMFKQASTGLKSRSEDIEKMGLTKKQFYSRLKKLVKLGLLTRVKGSYVHTALGRFVNSIQIKPLEEALANYWNLLAIDELKKSKVIPEQEQERIIKSITDNSDLKEYLSNKNLEPVKIIKSYEGLSKEVLKLIDSAKTEIFIASRYYEPQVSLRLMRKFSEGVSLNILDGNPSGTPLQTRLEAALKDPKTQQLAKAMLESPKVRLKTKLLTYSFIITDGEYCGFEVVDPLKPHEFNLAVEFRDEEISNKMKIIFENLWKTQEIVTKKVPAKKSKT
jgi:predicted transcriptional regulator